MNKNADGIKRRTVPKGTPLCPVSAARIFMPYGMREIPGYGENVWEFFNRDYIAIGAPFRFQDELDNDFLSQVAWDHYGVDMAAEPGKRMVVFGMVNDDRECKVLRNVARVMALPIASEIDEIAEQQPKSWAIRSVLEQPGPIF